MNDLYIMLDVVSAANLRPERVYAILLIYNLSFFTKY